MKILANITEYNPFHNGHKYHLQEAKRQSNATHTMVLMSGHVVQRGEFAILDKWQRAKLALQNEADLVVELPYVFSGQNAEIFGSGAVSILDATKTCHTLSFGAEAGHNPQLMEIAQFLSNEPQNYKDLLRLFLNQGISFAQARSLSIGKLLGNEASFILSQPNNILAIEYLKALHHCDSQITPLAIKRKGAGYHSQNPVEEFASASYLRHTLTVDHAHPIQSYLPYSTKNFSKKIWLLQRKNYELAVFSKLLSCSPEKLRQLPDMEDGLEFRLKTMVKTHHNLGQLIQATSSKRITKSRIQRILMHLVMEYFDKDQLEFKPFGFTPYLRVLGFNSKGQEILRAISKNSDMPIITNVRSNQTRLDKTAFDALNLDIKATNLFYLLRGQSESIQCDYQKHPIKLT